MDYISISKVILISIIVIYFKHLYFKLLRKAIQKQYYNTAISMRIFSRFISILGKWAIVFLSLFILGLFFEGVLKWNFVGIFGAVMFYMVQISIIYNLSHFLKALVSIVNYYYHFRKYVLYLHSFKKDQTDFDRRFIIPIQQYTNLKYLGIGDPNLLYLDTTHFSLSDNKIDLSLVFRD